MISVLSVVAIVAVFSAQTTFAGECKGSKQKDIVDTAVSAGSFNTLVAAVKAACEAGQAAAGRAGMVLKGVFVHSPIA